MSEFSYFATIEEGDDPKLFLASPGDVQDLRLMAQQVVDDLDGVGGPANSMTMFAWETTLKETLFNDAAPIQNQIYLPSDPLCKGVVAFFGERIGQPLAEDFPTHMLEELFANNPSDYYKMVRHWRPEEADRGGFPLTGSTFEVLVAIATDRRFKNTASGQELPMFLRFLAPKDVLEIEDPGRAKWGNRKLRKKMMELFEEDDNALDEKRLMIREQLKSLRNFAMYLKHIGLEPIFEPDERKIEEDFRKYLASNFVLTRDPLLHDPFRGLQFYDVHDNRSYFGRDTDVKNALSAIEKMCNAPKKRNCYWIKGISGVGKSSFLRAGIIGSFIYSPKYQTDYAYSVNRPNHLLNASAAKVAQTACPLRVLFEKCADAIRERPNCAEFLVGGIAPLLEDFDKLEPEKRPEWAARKLTACLGNAEGQEPGARHNRLVIGIDQFEEIVDMLDDEKLGPHWQLFIKFMELAPAQPDIVIISTFRKERLDKMLRHPELNALWHDTSLQCTDLAFPSPTELENIIRKPFEDHGRVSLDDALVAALREKIMLHVDRPRATTSGSFLPLVSLALQRLQVNVALPLIEKQFERKEQDAAPQDALKAAAAKRPAGKDKPSRVRVGLKDAVDYLDLEGAIAELAASAMNEAKEANALAAGEATVDNLLRQLVRWSGRDDKQFFLPHVPLPTDNAEKSLAKALIKHRLLVDDGEAGILLVHETVLKKLA
ncbi:hypothetical protein C1J03_15675 [Sulfitobacter sp. SK012]|uniref:nSTAND1 domain-containing NTPase n=1 Tax=Sulfitobacter sp. SK012 TaxID=1389005 RepID=UPI000E0ADF8C|nr:hypothetical protein [Sulfitobacter sp. SK012]AXI47322.1 hypothetical protein C1J03_15675 [Sulfitobacter sp. SK012]